MAFLRKYFHFPLLKCLSTLFSQRKDFLHNLPNHYVRKKILEEPHKEHVCFLLLLIASFMTARAPLTHYPPFYASLSWEREKHSRFSIKIFHFPGGYIFFCESEINLDENISHFRGGRDFV